MENKRAISQIFRYSLILLFSLSTLQLSSQGLSVDDNRATKYFSEAQQLYRSYKLKEAESLLLKAVEREPQFFEAFTLLGYVYLDQNNLTKAKEAFSSAVVVDVQKIPNNLFFLGQLELQDGNYEEAKKQLERYLAQDPREPSSVEKSRQSLEKIDFALRAIANPVEFEPINLGPEVNTELAEYFPSLTVDKQMLLFTRRLPAPQTPQGFNEDFFVSRSTPNEKWQTASNINKPINTRMNEGAPTLSADGQILIFTGCELYGNYGGNRQGFGSCDLFYSERDGDQWSEPVNMGNTINTQHWETQPSFSADGRTLYFVRGIRDRKGNRSGDIYHTTLNDKGYWSTPQKLPANVNTSGNEESVFIHPDGKSLYFASDGHPGMGGLDIYLSRKLTDSTWTDPINLGYPINTHKNENSLLVAADGEMAYFASDREGGFGELDLYKFHLQKSIAPGKVTYFSGKIFDAETKGPLAASFDLIDLNTSEAVVKSYSEAATGHFLVTIPAGKDYALNVSKDGYLFYSENFSLAHHPHDNPFHQDIPLQPIEVGKKIVLKNIFFETAKYNLKPESKIELEKLIEFMNRNPSLIIEVSGHTDSEGSEEANQLLSESRAQAVTEYLIANGIDKGRLQAKGYGENQPIADNATEQGRAQNRRTEFKIIEK